MQITNFRWNSLFIFFSFNFHFKNSFYRCLKSFFIKIFIWAYYLADFSAYWDFAFQITLDGKCVYYKPMCLLSFQRFYKYIWEVPPFASAAVGWYGSLGLSPSIAAPACVDAFIFMYLATCSIFPCNYVVGNMHIKTECVVRVSSLYLYIFPRFRKAPWFAICTDPSCVRV